MASSGASSDGGGGASAALVSGDPSSEAGAPTSAAILLEAFGQMPQHMKWEFFARFVKKWPPYNAQQLATVDEFIAQLVYGCPDGCKGALLAGVQSKISECAKFRREMQSKYSAASPLALDYIMMLKGEHGLLEFLSNSQLDANFSVSVDHGVECVTCTWWWADDPSGGQPLLHVKMLVGPGLDGAPTTILMFSEVKEAHAKAIWSQVPLCSFLRRGIFVQTVVEKFVDDEADALLETYVEQQD